jgi:hypothetical protein
MSSRLQKLFETKVTRKGFIKGSFLLFVSSFAIYGVIEQLLSNAATPSGSTEADSGSKTGAATVVANTATPDDKAVEFGTAGGTTTASSLLPIVPSSLAGVPTTLVFHDEFDTGVLDTTRWVPGWYWDANVSNDTTMYESNVSVGDNGLALLMNSQSSGGMVNSQPWANGFGVNGHPGTPIDNFEGFTISPFGADSGYGTGTSPGSGPVYVEFKALDPASSDGGMANWMALWLAGQEDPTNGEIDVVETGEIAKYTIHYGAGGDTNQPGTYATGDVSMKGGAWHTFGVLWTTTSVTFVYDGAIVAAQVGSFQQSSGLEGPMGILMENSYGGVAEVFPSTIYIRYVRVWQG